VAAERFTFGAYSGRTPPVEGATGDLPFPADLFNREPLVLQRAVPIDQLPDHNEIPGADT
jgi:hypothetical protein